MSLVTKEELATLVEEALQYEAYFTKKELDAFHKELVYSIAQKIFDGEINFDFERAQQNISYKKEKIKGERFLKNHLLQDKKDFEQAMKDYQTVKSAFENFLTLEEKKHSYTKAESILNFINHTLGAESEYVMVSQDEHRFDFSYGLLTLTIFSNLEKNFILQDSLEVWGHDGELIGYFSEKELYDKMDELNQQFEELKDCIKDENYYSELFSNRAEELHIDLDEVNLFDREIFSQFFKNDPELLVGFFAWRNKDGYDDFMDVYEGWQDDYKELAAKAKDIYEIIHEYKNEKKNLHDIIADAHKEKTDIKRNHSMISFNGKIYQIELDHDGSTSEQKKWHNYHIQNIHNQDEVYIFQIVQDCDEEPRFSAEVFEKDCEDWDGWWVELSDVIKDPSEIKMVEMELIKLSDEAIAINNQINKRIDKEKGFGER